MSRLHRTTLLAMVVPLLALFSAGCPTLDLQEAPLTPGSCNPDPSYFRDRIWPEFLNPADMTTNCVEADGCHGSENGKSALRLEVVDSPDLATHDRNYAVTKRFLNCGSPDLSAALTKPLTGEDSHGGGDLFPPGSPQEQVFLGWFAGP